MNALKTFLRWLRDSLPIYNYRRCCREWLAGREHGMKEIGFVRGEHGKFRRAR